VSLRPGPARTVGTYNGTLGRPVIGVRSRAITRGGEPVFSTRLSLSLSGSRASTASEFGVDSLLQLRRRPDAPAPFPPRSSSPLPFNPSTIARALHSRPAALLFAKYRGRVRRFALARPGRTFPDFCPRHGTRGPFPPIHRAQFTMAAESSKGAPGLLSRPRSRAVSSAR
jgi:hypothetical protein